MFLSSYPNFPYSLETKADHEHKWLMHSSNEEGQLFGDYMASEGKYNHFQ